MTSHIFRHARRSLIALVVVISGACSDRGSEPAPAPAPVAEPQLPTARVLYLPGREHEPGDLLLQCVAEDLDGDLVSVTLVGGSTDTIYTVAGRADTVSAEIRELPAGEHQLICTVTDSGGRTHADTITIGVAPNESQAAPLFVTQSGLDWTIVQGLIVDPQGDTLEYTIEIEGPITLALGPRTSPIDTTLTLPYGSYRIHSIVSDGFVADTTVRSFDHRAPPDVSQSIVRDGVSFRYAATHTGTFARLTVTRSAGDTIYIGPVPADTAFVGLNPGDQNGLLKGIYLFVLQADREGVATRDVVLDSIVDLQPSVDLSGIDATLDQEARIVLLLPTPVDPNPEDLPTYTRVRSLDGKVEVSLSGVNLTEADLSIVGAADSTGAYEIELVLGLAATGVLVDTLAGVIRPRPADTEQVESQDSVEFKSGYEDVVVAGGATSVSADLVDDDESKNPLLEWNFAEDKLGWFYDFKRMVNNKYRLALGIDYSFTNQFSSFSSTDTQAASGIFRVFGTWTAFGSRESMSGTVVGRIENRHLIGSGVTPRDLGFDGGSSLSTATFKDFGWGLTILHWKQLFEGGKYLVVAGKMDAGDYSDVYPFLTAYKAFMNDASHNNPSVALPQQGLGIVGKAAIGGNWYASAGLHDANGSPTAIGFDTFFEGEYYTWVEGGWTPDNTGLSSGEGVHVNLWHQDARVDEGTEETWGVTFSASKIFEGGLTWSPYLRAGYAEGDGGELVRFVIAGGVGAIVRGSDAFGIATSWSGPIDSTLRNQVTSEAFYRLQLTENIQASPVVHFTINPSQTLETDALWVVGMLRLRLAL